METVDPDATTPGDRQRYQTSFDSAVLGNRSYLPALVMYFQFELNQLDTSVDREVVLGSL